MSLIKNKILFPFIFIAFIIQGCATYPTDPIEQAHYWANKANTSIKKNKSDELWTAVYSGSAIAEGGDLIKNVFDTNPKAEALFKREALERFDKYPDLRDALFLRNQVYEMWLSGVLPVSTGEEVLEEIDGRIIKRHKSGEYELTLADDVSNIKALNNDTDKQLILKNSLNKLKKNSAGRVGLVKILMEKATKEDTSSNDFLLIKSSLNDLNINKKELIYVAPVFPDFAKKRESEVSLLAYLSLINGDALLKDDLIKILRKRVKGVTWVKDPSQAALVIEIEKVRHEEKELPPYIETITYSQGQVNFLAGALLMPNNASYLYDVSKTKSSLEYGYVIKALGVEELLVRGLEQSVSVECLNTRIHNVFGGVSSADFIANNDMKNRCAKSGNKDIGNLRDIVYGKVVDGILKIPSVKKVHTLNQ